MTRGVKKGAKQHKWSKDEVEYLKLITPGRHHTEIHKLMNEKFEYNFGLTQVKSAIKRYNLKTGFTGHFQKGQSSWNKGTKGLTHSNITSFKKGNIPLNYKPVGSERVNVGGYTEIKVADPNKWRLKHRVVYEKHNGPIPVHHAVIFADGNKTNLNIDNLILVTRQQLQVLNKHKLIQKDSELTKTGINVANIILKTTEVKKKLKK